MLAYAANRRSRRRPSVPTLVLIVGAHALGLVILATAKVALPDLPQIIRTKIYDVPVPPPPQVPPPPRSEPRVQAEPQPAPDSQIDRPTPIINRPLTGPTVDLGPPIMDRAPDIGTALETPLTQPIERFLPLPPVWIAARATTPADLLRPPYPESRRRSEEEAVLRLRLSIDPRGRVTAVDPVGTADPAFLAAARVHLLRHWRYRAATEDGRAIASSLTITLRFELEDE